jgi:hypothetical protein
MRDRPSTCNATVRNAVRVVMLALMLLQQCPCSKQESPPLSSMTRMSCWLQMALKCADLGHLAAPWAVHQRWVAGLEEELFRQGDNEKQLHMLISPLMDRSKGGITKSQVSQMEVRCARQASQCLKAACRQCVLFPIIVHNAGQTHMFATYCALHATDHIMHTEHVIRDRQYQLSVPSNKIQQKHPPAAGECHGCLSELHNDQLGWVLENMPLVTPMALITVIIMGLMQMRHCCCHRPVV